MGKGQFQDMSAAELLEEASKTYEAFHIHIGETSSGRRPSVVDGWKQIMSDNLMVAQQYSQVSDIIKDTIIAETDVKQGSTNESEKEKAGNDSKEEEILL
jgi:hypothetical protein